MRMGHIASTRVDRRWIWCCAWIICSIIPFSLMCLGVWLVYGWPRPPITCLFSNKDLSTNASSCHLVQIRDNNVGTRTEKRCYPLVINYGDRCCTKSQDLNCRTSIRYGAQQCIKLNRRVFEDDLEFYERNKDVLKRSRGAGYWLWKSYAIYRELYLAREGDIIIYADAATTFIANVSYLTQLTEQQDVIVFELFGQKDRQWTKRDAFIIMNVDKPEYIDTPAKLASFVVVKKSWMSMRFVGEWLTYAQDGRAVTDDENVLGKDNYAGFRENRHDQSVLSLLSKKWKLKIFQDPSQWGVTPDRKYPTIFNQHRIKD